MDTCHSGKPQTDDGKLLADIDLTSFGLPWKKYLADGKNVQKELRADSSGSAKSPKIGFLENLRKRESIYFSTYYLEHYEKAAQENINSHLAQLQKAASPGGPHRYWPDTTASTIESTRRCASAKV